MKTPSDPIKLIPIAQILVTNPRCRDQKKFAQIVDSISKVGLKKPIKVSLRTKAEGGEQGYDLVYGQGRIEACQKLGFKEIPALVVSLSKEDGMLFSLMENLVRKFPSRGELITEILRLKEAGYSNVKIGKKIGITDSVVGNYLSLIDSKEEKLLRAVLKETIPLEVAVEIAKAETPAQQRAFLKAYESGKFGKTEIRVVKKMLTLRNGDSKTPADGPSEQGRHANPSPEEMVKMYQKETQKMRGLVHKTKVCEAKTLIVTTAFKTLLADEAFKELLASHGLTRFPQPLADKLHMNQIAS